MLRGSQAGVGGRKFAELGSVDGGVRGFLGFRFEVLGFPFGGSALCLTLYESRQNTGFARWAKSRALYQ